MKHTQHPDGWCIDCTEALGGCAHQRVQIESFKDPARDVTRWRRYCLGCQRVIAEGEHSDLLDRQAIRDGHLVPLNRN